MDSARSAETQIGKNETSNGELYSRCRSHVLPRVSEAVTAVFKGRTTFVGGDLEPLDATSIALDLDRDPLPDARFDYAVLLGVFAYLHQPEPAAEKICNSADHVIVSYCCRRADLEPQVVLESRRQRGWVNSFDRTEFIQLFSRYGHELFSSLLLNATDEIEEFLMEFRRSDVATRRSSEGHGLVND